jgi:osmotically-inducible protein OsmY
MNALEQNIMESLAGNPRVDPDEISVQAFGGDVALRGTGTVRSRADHDIALTAAATAPGVTDVHDEMRIAG